MKHRNSPIEPILAQPDSSDALAQVALTQVALVQIAEPAQPAEPAHLPKDLVWVRVNVDYGMLAGKAVYLGERHRVMYYQYEQARQANKDGYVLTV
jgi:hypothetical protein